MNYVAEEGAECMLSAAVSLCNPFDLIQCNKALTTGFSQIYDYSLSQKLGEIMG